MPFAAKQVIDQRIGIGKGFQRRWFLLIAVKAILMMDLIGLEHVVHQIEGIGGQDQIKGDLADLLNRSSCLCPRSLVLMRVSSMNMR